MARVGVIKEDKRILKHKSVLAFLSNYPKKTIDYNAQQKKQIKHIANNPKFEKNIIFDKIVAIIALFLLWPAYILLAIIIYLKMSGPVLFTQKRVGQHGKLFKIYKLLSELISST